MQSNNQISRTLAGVACGLASIAILWGSGRLSYEAFTGAFNLREIGIAVPVGAVCASFIYGLTRSRKALLAALLFVSADFASNALSLNGRYLSQFNEEEMESLSLENIEAESQVAIKALETSAATKKATLLTEGQIEEAELQAKVSSLETEIGRLKDEMDFQENDAPQAGRGPAWRQARADRDKLLPQLTEAQAALRSFQASHEARIAQIEDDLTRSIEQAKVDSAAKTSAQRSEVLDAGQNVSYFEQAIREYLPQHRREAVLAFIILWALVVSFGPSTLMGACGDMLSQNQRGEDKPQGTITVLEERRSVNESALDLVALARKSKGIRVEETTEGYLLWKGRWRERQADGASVRQIKVAVLIAGESITLIGNGSPTVEHRATQKGGTISEAYSHLGLSAPVIALSDRDRRIQIRKS